jgi:heme-degrading monooxygenase HmoA
MLWARAEDGTSMFVILWEFEVKPGCEQSFESAYGREGAWTRLFRRDSGYLDTPLLKHPTCPRIYFTLDFWHSTLAFDSLRDAHREDYQALDRATDHLTIHEERIGSYEQFESGNSSS